MTRAAQNSQLNSGVLTSLVATRVQQRLAFALDGLLVCIVLLTLPTAQQHWPTLPTFLATFVTFALLTNLLTAYVLFRQFMIMQRLDLALLAASYLYAGCMIIPYMLTFSGLYAPGGLFHANTQTTSWLWVFWHVGFSLGILLYALTATASKKRQLSARQTTDMLTILLLLIPGLVLLASLVALSFVSFLPRLLDRNNHSLLLSSGVGSVVIITTIVATLAVALRLRDREVVHIWLHVPVVAAFLEVALTLYAGSRYSIGWYVARVNSMLTAGLILCALLYEIGHLYQRLKVQHEELSQHTKRQTNFLSVISHEFRTALTSIDGFSQVLSTQECSPEEVKEFAGDMQADAQRLTHLITELLDLEQMKTGTMVVRQEAIEINTLLTDSITGLSATPLSSHFHLDLAPSLPPLLGDPELLTQVITKLLANALKYAPHGGDIFIGSRRQGEQVHLLIQDQGIGIPSDALEEIFEPYARVEARHTHYVSGSGLGLPTVRQIVEIHQGHVWVESTLGQGACFHILLPFAPGEE